MVATLNMLSRNQVIAYVGQHAPTYGLDPAAVLAVANHEGLNQPGGKWWLTGEHNWSFGPPSWYGNGAGAAILQRFGGNSDQAAAWAWSPEGVDYWLQQVATSARGLTGIDAIRAIVTGFERPRADLVAGEVTNASRDYGMFQTAIGAVQVPTLTAPGEDTATSTVQPAVTTPANTSPSGSLVAAGQVGGFPIGLPSGLLLGLIAVLLLVVGAIIMSGTERVKQVTGT